MNVAYSVALALGFGATMVVMPSRTSGAGQAATISPTAARAECKVEGVWELVTLTFDGREMKFLSRPEQKIVARGHWMWIGADARRDTLPLRTWLGVGRMATGGITPTTCLHAREQVAQRCV